MRKSKIPYYTVTKTSEKMLFLLRETGSEKRSQIFPASVCATYSRRREWQAPNLRWWERKKIIMQWLDLHDKLDAKQFYLDRIGE